MSKFYRFAQFASFVYFRLFHRFEIKGLQKVVSLNKQAGRTGFTAAQYGPQMANTYGAGQAAMNVDTKFIQQKIALLRKIIYYY